MSDAGPERPPAPWQTAPTASVAAAAGASARAASGAASLPTRLDWATARTPAPAARAVVGLAVFAGAVVVGAPMGAALSVALLALGAVAARVRRPPVLPATDLRARVEPPGRDRWTRAWWALAAALALMPVLRAATWVVVPALLAAVALGSLAATGGRRWAQLGAGLGAIWARLPQGAALTARAATRDVAWRGAGPAARGLALAAVLLAVFVPLLATADAAFAQLLDDVTPSELNVDLPLARALAAALALAAGGALIYARISPPQPNAPRPPKLALTRLEWAVPLAALVALFAAFVALQLATLFGGRRHVLDTAGLTYAEYARSGFAQLLAVAALTLAVVAAARRWARDDGVLLKVLLTALCLLTLVVLASAVKRLHLYEETFGFTRLRLAADAALLYLGALFALILTVRGAQLPRAVVATTAGAVLIFALSDPERRIAGHNVERFERTGKLDAAYLRSLGADAAPALPPCLRATVEPDGLAGFNLARAAARRTRTDRRTAASAPCGPRRPTR